VTLFADWRIEVAVLPTRPDAPYGLHPQTRPQEVIQYFDVARVVGPLTIRYRLAGDVFQPCGLAGKKTIKKFFIDRKIPGDKRNLIPLLFDTRGLIWVVGYAIAERVKITAVTQHVLRCHMYCSQS
jgi:tRNA(Ile)-lysidine synthetase-like protein